MILAGVGVSCTPKWNEVPLPGVVSDSNATLPEISFSMLLGILIQAFPRYSLALLSGSPHLAKSPGQKILAVPSVLKKQYAGRSGMTLQSQYSGGRGR